MSAEEDTQLRDDVLAAFVDGDETEEEESSVPGKRLLDGAEYPLGKRLKTEDVVETGDDDEEDDDDDDDDDDDEDDDEQVAASSPHRPFSKNDAKNFNMKNAKTSGYSTQAPVSTHSPKLQRLLDSIDRKTKTELFSDALDTCGNELFQGHESWRDQLLIKACRLDPSFVTTITDLARPNGTSSSPLILSGEEDEAEEDEDNDDEPDDDDDGTSSVEVVEQDPPQSGDEEDELNLVSGDDEPLELGDLSSF